MLWLNRMLQRLSLTRREAMALLTLSALLSFGLVVRNLPHRSLPTSGEAQEAFDRLYFERSAGLSIPTESEAAAVPGAAPDEQVPDPDGPLPAPDAGMPPPDTHSASRSERVDLNSAGTEELEALPRIGPKTAARILDYRARYGPFLLVDDLQQISGIGEKTVELLRPLVIVRHVRAHADTARADPARADPAHADTAHTDTAHFDPWGR